MSYIVLFTDFGNSPYPGIMKGVISGINPNARIVDLCHHITPQSIAEASFILTSSYSYFPEGSIFLCVIDPGVGTGRRILLIQTRYYYFIAPDNGLLSGILSNETPLHMISVDNREYFLDEVCDTFHGRDIFAPAGAHLSLGTDINSFGSSIDNPVTLEIEQPQAGNGKIRGKVIFSDSFGNLVTNIPEKILSQEDRRSMIISCNDRELKGVRRNYRNVDEGCPLALIGSFGYLELSVSNGNAADFFRAGPETEVTIKTGDAV
jgi:S-adenosylmethionine hydrolase